jgi:serine/threonine protein kinase
MLRVQTQDLLCCQANFLHLFENECTQPANFLFVKGVLKLIDFGIAKAIQNDETTNIHRENHVGTLNYMSPESMMDSGKGANGALIKCGRVSHYFFSF